MNDRLFDRDPVHEPRADAIYCERDIRMVTEENGALAVGADEPESRPGGIPLYVWVLGAVVLAIPVGFLGRGATRLDLLPEPDHPGPRGPGGAPGRPGDPQCDRLERHPGPSGGPDDGLLPDQHPGRHGFGLLLSNLIRPGLGPS